MKFGYLFPWKTRGWETCIGKSTPKVIKKDVEKQMRKMVAKNGRINPRAGLGRPRKSRYRSVPALKKLQITWPQDRGIEGIDGKQWALEHSTSCLRARWRIYNRKLEERKTWLEATSLKIAQNQAISRERLNLARTRLIRAHFETTGARKRLEINCKSAA